MRFWNPGCTYGADELNIVEADFPELDNIPSLREAQVYV